MKRIIMFARYPKDAQKFISLAHLLKRWIIEERLSKEETYEGEMQERKDKLRELGIWKDPKAHLVTRLRTKEREKLDRFAKLLVESLQQPKKPLEENIGGERNES